MASADIYGAKTLFREYGYYISRLEQYERSLTYFDRAVKITPSDRRALMGRAWARSKACRYEAALEDIKKSLRDVDPNDLPLLAIEALNKYLSCEFEAGLVQNTRLLPKRKKPDYFELGALQCTDAIENCLGERAGRPLRDHYLIIRNLAWKKNVEDTLPPEQRKKKKRKKQKKVQSLKNIKSKSTMALIALKQRRSSKFSTHSGDDYNRQFVIGQKESEESVHDEIYSQKSELNIVPPPKKFPYQPLQRYTSNIEKYMAEKYLDSLYKDKLFLKTLSSQAGVVSPNEKGTQMILQLAKTGYKTVKYKQELLRSRRPFYFIKYQEVASSGNLKKRQEEELQRIIRSTEKEANNIETKMERALAGKNWKQVLDGAEDMVQFCESKPKKIFPHRKRYLSAVYERVCQAHFDLKRINPRKMPWDTQRRIWKLLGLPISRPSSRDSVIEQLNTLRNVKKSIDVFSERLSKANSPEELCWIYYELCRNYNNSKQYEMSRSYAKRCIHEARRINNNRWIINGLFELIKTNTLQHSKTEVYAGLAEALNVATKMENESLIEFVKQCQYVVDKMDFEANSMLQQRECKIVEMMGDDQMKNEATFFFKRMANMPAGRRMSMMPGMTQASTDASRSSADTGANGAGGSN